MHCCWYSFIEVFSPNLFVEDASQDIKLQKNVLFFKIFITKIIPCIFPLGIFIGIHRIFAAIKDPKQTGKTSHPGIKGAIPQYPSRNKCTSIFLLVRGVLEVIGLGIICLILEIILSLFALIDKVLRGSNY